MTPKKWPLALSAALACVIMAGHVPVAHADEDAELWASIQNDVFGEGRQIADGEGKLELEAPYRAEDAAVVPITITIPAGTAPKIRKLTLIVDKNPAPVVAAFSFGAAAGEGERKIETRVRINQYSNVRAVIETADGSAFMQTKFVKAAGGCSAPALKDKDEALASIGKMKLRPLAPRANVSSSATANAQIMVRHPNYSGMQMNQLTGLYIPAKFLEHMKVRKGDQLVFEMTSGISLSENPHITFSYAVDVEGPLSVSARDTDGKVFTTTADVTGS